MRFRVSSLFAFLLFASLLFAAVFAAAQNVAPPVPQRLDIHSKVLNEDRVIWVRLPDGYEQSKAVYPVLYQTDAPQHVNETGGVIDYLVTNDRMPQLIVVGIANTDRTRDLTPSRADAKNPDGTSVPFPTSGGADKFLEFIQTELMPEIEHRYRTAPYKIFAGHSFGGLLAIHTLVNHPDMFDAYIAVSPSLQWDDGRTLHQAQQFFASQKELKKTLFFSLASEGNTPNPMGANFDAFNKTLEAHTPKGFVWKMARYPDEDHGSTTLLAHYAGLKEVFTDWQMPRDPKTFQYVGGLQGVEQHYRTLSERYGYAIPIPEATLNQFGYQLMGAKKHDDAILVFKRNVALYPASANVYDSLGEGLEAAGKYDDARQNFEKAIEMATKTNDPVLPQFKQHLERVTAEAKGDGAKGTANK
jgi:predicted alpha/beta superfamily hydrolase